MEGRELMIEEVLQLSFLLAFRGLIRKLSLISLGKSQKVTEIFKTQNDHSVADLGPQI